MQHVSDIDQIKNVILQLVLENPGSQLLPNLANQLGLLFAAQACIVVTTSNLSSTNQVNYWQQSIGLIDDGVINQLSRLTIDQLNEQAFVPHSSGLLSELDQIMQTSWHTKTWLGMTTQFQHQTNGLVLLLKSQSSTWTQAEHELLTKTLDLMAIAISQAQLQQQTRTKTRYQTLLKNLSREISQGYQPQLLFDSCLTEICKALQVDRGLVLMLKYQNPLRAKGRSKNSVKGTAKIACQWNAQTPSSLTEPELSFNLNDSDLCQKAWQNAPNCLKFDADTVFPDLATDLLHPWGSALLMMPLMGKKTSETDSAMVLGFIVLQHNTTRYWSQDEVELIDWVGVQVSTALIHHQTLNQVQLIVDERTAQLKSSIDMQAKLSAKMRQHIKQLQKLNQLKDDFMNSMSHELKTPLTSMKMAIKMLRQAQIPPQMREKYLDILEQEWNREYNLIKDLLKLQELESGELDFSPQELNLPQTVAQLTHNFAPKLQQREITLSSEISEPDLKIYTDAESLSQVLHELLANAGKYSDSDTTIELSVSSEGDPKSENILISVANVGAGILPEELPYIFDKFRRGQGVTDRAVPGTGLGLTLVQYLVEHLSGTIEVTSEPLEDDSGAFLTT
ncbi:MAG: ATP-binding protein, partial [Cyanobacteria bacterium J06642_3]